jgi:hypothetical protein
MLGCDLDGPEPHPVVGVRRDARGPVADPGGRETRGLDELDHLT